MRSVSRLIIPVALLAGCTFGYFSPFGASPGSTAAGTTIESGRSAGLPLTREPRNTALPQPSESNLTILFQKYADFTPQETREEFARLSKILKEKKIYDHNLSETTSYLSFKMGALSPEDAMQLLQDKDFSKYENFYSSVLEGWAEKDFQGAMSYLLAHKKESDYAYRTFSLLSKDLAQKDPGKARQWLTTLTQGERVAALDAMIETFPLNHPERMTEFLTLAGDGSYSIPKFHSKLAEAWAKSDWDAARTWIDTLKGRTKREVLAQAFAGLSKKDLPKATEKLKKEKKSNSNYIGSTIVINFPHADKLQGKPLDWIIENKECFANPVMVVRSCVRNISYQTPELTRKVLQLPEGQIRDSALEIMVSQRSSTAINGDYYDGDTSEAAFPKILELASHIGNAQTRNTAASGCIDYWIRKSPEEARLWITEKSNLTDREKQTFLQKCDASR